MVTIDFIIRIKRIVCIVNHGDQEFRFRTAPVVVRNDRVAEVILQPAMVQRNSFITLHIGVCMGEFFYPKEDLDCGTTQGNGGRWTRPY